MFTATIGKLENNHSRGFDRSWEISGMVARPSRWLSKFVIYCLHETISQPEIRHLIQKHQTHLEELGKQRKTTPEQIDIENRKYFKKLDEQIHQAKGKHYLKNEEIAQIVAN